MLTSPLPDQEGNKLQRPNSGFIQLSPHEARCSNFCKILKKIRILSLQPGLRGSNDLRVGRKMATFQLFFQSREQMVVRRGQSRRVGWVIKTLEAQLCHFLLNSKCPVSRGIVVQEKESHGDFSREFFL